MNANNCGKQAMGIDGSVMATCDLPAGHIGDHQDAVRGTVWTNKESLHNGVENEAMCGARRITREGVLLGVCHLVKGHDGNHRDDVIGMDWLNTDSTGPVVDPVDEPESPLPGPNDAMELGRINNQVVSMRRWGTLQPGGGMLNVYEFDPADFGVIGGAVITGLRDTTKKVRRTAVADVLRLVRTLKLVTGKEEVVSVSVGADSLGNMALVIVTKIGGAPR